MKKQRIDSPMRGQGGFAPLWGCGGNAPKVQRVQAFFLGMLIGICGWPLCSFAQKPQTPVAWIDVARKAYAKHQLDAVQEALTKAEQSLVQKKQNYTAQERTHIRLWLLLLWSRYHRFQAKTPAFQMLSIREDATQIREQLRFLTYALRHTQEAAKVMNRYHRLYRKSILQRTNLRQMLMVINTKRQEEHLLNRVGILQNRIGILRLLLSQKKLREATRGMNETVQELRQETQALSTEMTAHAEEILTMRRLYQREQKKARSHQRQQQGLLWGGIIGLLLGGGLLGGGVAAHLAVEERDSQGLRRYDIQTARDLTNTSTGLLVGGGVLATLGLGALVWLWLESSTTPKPSTRSSKELSFYRERSSSSIVWTRLR